MQCEQARHPGGIRDPGHIVALTGLSEYYLWQVRKGEKRLHARFWETIASA
jgi:hypothetical protein